MLHILNPATRSIDRRPPCPDHPQVRRLCQALYRPRCPNPSATEREERPSTRSSCCTMIAGGTAKSEPSSLLAVTQERGLTWCLGASNSCGKSITRKTKPSTRSRPHPQTTYSDFTPRLSSGMRCWNRPRSNFNTSKFAVHACLYKCSERGLTWLSQSVPGQQDVRE